LQEDRLEFREKKENWIYKYDDKKPVKMAGK
jgi:hypothetical protein